MQPQSESFEITIGSAHTAACGLVITLRADGHKHAVSGSLLSRWKLEIMSNGKTESIDYSFSSGGMHWYFEGVAHGWVYTVEELFAFGEPRQVFTTPEGLDKNSRRRVTLTPRSEPALEPDAVWEKGITLAEAEAKRRGCVGDGSSSGRKTDGTVSYTVHKGNVPQCHILVGVYSGKIFFKKADPLSKGRRKKRRRNSLFR